MSASVNGSGSTNDYRAVLSTYSVGFGATSSTQTVDVCYALGSTSNTIDLNIGSLSAVYGGANTTGTTPTATASGNTVTVTAAQDVTISGFSVVPSNTSKQWEIVSDNDTMSPSPSSGTGTKSVSVEVSKFHTNGGCFYAKYTDNSARSSTVCITKSDGGSTATGTIYVDVELDESSCGSFYAAGDAQAFNLSANNSNGTSYSGYYGGNPPTENAIIYENAEAGTYTFVVSNYSGVADNSSGINDYLNVRVNNVTLQAGGTATATATVYCDGAP